MLARAIFPDESGMLMEAMFGEVETLAYVIDSECRVVYFNKKMEVAFPHLKTGMLCYQALRGEPASSTVARPVYASASWSFRCHTGCNALMRAVFCAPTPHTRGPGA